MASHFILTQNLLMYFFSFETNNSRIGAHKILLAKGSGVFNSMFFGKLKENGDVKVVEASESAFKKFLQYFYFDEVPLSEKNIADMIQLAVKYNVKKCFEDCIQFLIEILNESDIWTALHLAGRFDNQELKKACDTFIIVNTTAIFKSTEFSECTKEQLAHIVKMNILSCSEVEVFEAMIAWVTAKCGDDALSKELVQKHLGKLYYEIRFKSMKIENLPLLKKYESILRNDFVTIMIMIVTPEFQPEHFNKFPRSANWDTNKIIECNRELHDVDDDDEFGWEIFEAKNETTFTTNKPLLLGELKCKKMGKNTQLSRTKINIRVILNK